MVIRKLIFIGAAAVSLVGCGRSDTDKRLAQSEIQRSIDENNARIQQQLLAAKTAYVRVKFGPAAAMQYELCNSAKPQSKQHQQQCDVLQEKVERSQKREPKW